MLKMLSDSADILHLKIDSTTVSLDLEWMNFPSHPQLTTYSFYKINAKKMKSRLRCLALRLI